MNKLLISLFFWIIILNAVFAQTKERTSGPIIENFGAVWQVENPDFKTDPSKIYKVVFDIYDRPDDPSMVNLQLNTLARFLNMHAQAGVPEENLQVAGVVHNKASITMVNKEAYKAEFGVDNPNVPLIQELHKAGAKIYICGQSINSRGIDRGSLAEPVQVGLSAITVILSLQQEGYELIRF